MKQDAQEWTREIVHLLPNVSREKIKETLDAAEFEAGTLKAIFEKGAAASPGQIGTAIADAIAAEVGKQVLAGTLKVSRVAGRRLAAA